MGRDTPRVLNAMRHWNVSYAYPEKNSASTNIENLHDEIEASGLNITLSPFTMTNIKKSKLVGLLYDGIHKDDLKLLDIPYANQELRAFVSKQTSTGLWTYEGASGTHDDTVVARMLAWYGCNNIIPEIW